MTGGKQGSLVAVTVAGSVAVGPPGGVLSDVGVDVLVAVLGGSVGPGSAGVGVADAVGVNSGAESTDD